MEIKPTNMTMNVLSTVINENPQAFAIIRGQTIEGTACFYPYLKGTILIYEIKGLPTAQECNGGIFGFHIHVGETCGKAPYDNTKGHFNPNDCPHPYHLGDLPPIFATKGKAWATLYIDKFKPKDIIGRTLVIHAHADDMHSQPAGNSGEKIACGKIKKF